VVKRSARVAAPVAARVAIRLAVPAAVRVAGLLGGTALLATSLGGCGGTRPNTTAATTAEGQAGPLLLVSYSVTKAAYDRILPKFQADWKRRTGQDLEVKTSYGGSGSQARAVIDGLDADLVTLALPADVLKLQEAGLVQPGWEKELPNDSTITHSVVTFLTRSGNPKGIRNWADLARPGVAVLTANPKTSGGARWNFLGLWGSVRSTGGSEQAAETFVAKVFANVSNLPKDAREASDAFLNRGQGDVLLTYENEALLAAKQGTSKDTSLVVPALNIRIDGPVAVVDRHVDRKGSRKAAEALAAYLQGEEAQDIFAEEGFRPVNAAVWNRRKASFAPVTTLFTAADLGGWPTIETTFFASGGVWDRLAAAGKR
jgi:sulfate transport system substrate-binding protein